MRNALLATSLLCATASPALAQYASPQSAPRGHYVRVPRAAPQAAVRELSPPLVRERIVIPRTAQQQVIWPPWNRLGYWAGRHMMKKHAPRMVVELAPEDLDAYRVAYQPQPTEVVAELPAPEEDVVFVPEEAPIFAAPREIIPPKAPPLPPLPAVRTIPGKAPGAIVRPRAVPRTKALPRAVPSPQASPGGDEAPPPPKVEAEEEPGAMEPAPGDDGE